MRRRRSGRAFHATSAAFMGRISIPAAAALIGLGTVALTAYLTDGLPGLTRWTWWVVAAVSALLLAGCAAWMEWDR